MRRLTVLLLVAVLLVVAFPVSAQKDKGSGSGIEVTCPDGTQIFNGVEVIINMRAGFTYTATAIGVNGYDPVIGVGDADSIDLCNDDDSTAGQYTVSLPSTGFVDSARTNAQMDFNYTGSGFGNTSIIVGSPDGSTGEFVLVFEGMAVTANDGSGVGAGDPFAIRLTPNMVDTGVPLEIYMISKVQQLDPFMQLVDVEKNVIQLSDGTRIECDDAGTSTCWGNTSELDSSHFVSNRPNQGTPAGSVDSMMSIDLDGWTLNEDPDLNFFNFLMTSLNQQTQGEYIVVFHMGTAGGSSSANTNQGSGTTTSNNNNSGGVASLGQGVPAPSNTKPDKTGNTGTGTDTGNTGNTGNTGTTTTSTGGGRGIEVTCPDGTQIFNGVEIIINMRAGFTYTATAIGVNGYDPVIAVGDADSIDLCNDDDSTAGQYTVSLPSTGFVDSARTNAQMDFNYTGSGFGNTSIIVGSPDGSTGEFVLVFEGMAVTANDGSGVGAGDPFAIRLTPNMVDTGVPLEIYMISKVQQLDPFMQLVDVEKNVIQLSDGTRIECDDAGTSSCWGNTSELDSSHFVSNRPNQGTPAGSIDSMMSIDLDGWTLNDDPDLNFFNFLMTSLNQSTFGEYIVVFHVGTAGGSSGGKPGK